MLRSKLLLILLSGALIVASCSDSGTDPDDPGNGEDPVEPTASVNNPEDEAVVEGEITFSINGESEEGFDEARIYVGEEQVETVENPSLPYEQTITTQNYNNGDYDLRAELDASEPDTTIEASVSTTFENYMVTLETDGYIEILNEYNDAAYMFIADPAGNVLREIELTSYSDGTIQLLPPSEIEGDAPEQYSVTIGEKTTDNQDNDAFYLNTDVGLPSWSTLNMSSSVSSGSDEEPTYTDLTVEMTNFEQQPLITEFYFEDYPNYPYNGVQHDGDVSVEVNVPEGSEDMVIYHRPNWNIVDNPVPLYYWEENPTELESPVSYDASEDFNEMVPHTVSNTSDIAVTYYNIWMTNAPDSFEEGDMQFLYDYRRQLGDANGSDPGYGIWVPEITERSFLTYMTASDENDSNVSHSFQSPVMDGFPEEFYIVDADVQVNNQSMDNVEMDITGSADYIRLSADASTDNYSQSWSVALPDTSSSFVFPHIADSLDGSVTNYNRSDFELSGVTSVDYGKFNDGYSSYLEWQYGTTDYGNIIEWATKNKALNTGSSQEKSHIPETKRSLDIKTPNEVHLEKDNQKILNPNN